MSGFSPGDSASEVACQKRLDRVEVVGDHPSVRIDEVDHRHPDDSGTSSQQ